jgi:hypothetical protein
MVKMGNYRNVRIAELVLARLSSLTEKFVGQGDLRVMPSVITQPKSDLLCI